MPPYPTQHGLLVRTTDYTPLRAFSQGGCYWDKAPQQLIRESGLAEFLPPVEMEKDDQGQFGRFHREQGRGELLSRSKPLGRRRVPPDQLIRLKRAIDEFKQRGKTDDAQPENRQLIERFQLPDLNQDPELYRLAGPWWNHRLQILWGCERIRNSSLPIAAAAEKLEPDKFYNLRRLLGALLLLLLLALPTWWLASNWTSLEHSLAHLLAPVPATATNGGPQLAASSSPSQARSPDAGAARAELQAQQAEADAAKAQADADRARQEADKTQNDVERKRKEADAAAATAAKAAQAARDARAAADRAKANALAAQQAAAEKARQQVPATPPLSDTPPSAASPTPPSPGAPPTESPTNTTSDQPPTAGQPATAPTGTPPQYEIVLADQGQPSPDGTMQVFLEVRPITGARRAVPVETWYYEHQTATSQNRLQTRLKGGDYPIKAVIVDPAGRRESIEAIVTVEPGKVITTGGKVSLRKKTE
jgi:hypothetical protein